MNIVLQLMVKPSDSTAFVGKLLSKELTNFKFTNCFLHDKDDDEESINLQINRFFVSGLIRYFTLIYVWLKLHNKKPNLIIAHRFKCIDISRFLSKAFNCPLIIIVHGTGEYERSYRKQVLSNLLNSGAKVICVSNYVRQYILSKKSNQTLDWSSQVITIENSLDFNKIIKQIFPKKDALSLLGLGDTKKMILGYIGRLANVKGVMDFVEVALLSERQDAHFVLIGDGQLMGHIKKRIKNHQNKSQISLLGFIPEAYRYIKAFDCIVLPSRSEGFPLALLEAAAGKVPFILTNIDIYKEILGDINIFYAPSDIKQLSEKIFSFEKLYQQGSLSEVGNQLSTHVINKYPYENFIRKYNDIISKSLQ